AVDADHGNPSAPELLGEHAGAAREIEHPRAARPRAREREQRGAEARCDLDVVLRVVDAREQVVDAAHWQRGLRPCAWACSATGRSLGIRCWRSRMRVSCEGCVEMNSIGWPFDAAAMF